MKKLLAMAILMASAASFAQPGQQGGRKNPMAQLTPEQRSELHVKKLTATLGLNESQQKEMKKIINEQQANHEKQKARHKAIKDSGDKPTGDEIYARENQRLDNEIAMNEKVRKILTKEQFDKWSDMKARHHHARKPAGKHRGKLPEPQPGE